MRELNARAAEQADDSEQAECIRNSCIPDTVSPPPETATAAAEQADVASGEGESVRSEPVNTPPAAVAISQPTSPSASIPTASSMPTQTQDKGEGESFPVVEQKPVAQPPRKLPRPTTVNETSEDLWTLLAADQLDSVRETTRVQRTSPNDRSPDTGTVEPLGAAAQAGSHDAPATLRRVESDVASRPLPSQLLEEIFQDDNWWSPFPSSETEAPIIEARSE